MRGLDRLVMVCGLASVLTACQLMQDLGGVDGGGDVATTHDVPSVDVPTAMDTGPAPDTASGPDVVVSRDTGPGVDGGGDAIAVRDGGSCADAAVVPGTPRPLFDEAVHLCGLYAACSGDGDWFGPCVDFVSLGLSSADYRTYFQGRALLYGDTVMFPVLAFMAQAEPTVRTCLAAATTCDAMFACGNAGTTSAPCTVAPLTSAASCSGSTLHVCGYAGEDMMVSGSRGGAAQMRQFAFDCSTMGSPCTVGGDTPTAEPNAVGCAPAACNFGSYVPSCAGAVAHNCLTGGLLDQLTCPSGTTCQVLTSSGLPDASCVGTGPVCDPSTFVARCNCDGTLVQCFNGHEAPTACQYGGCSVGPDGQAECRDGSTCGLDGISCDAATGRITLCSGGRQGVVDCRGLGYATCGPGSFSTGVFCQ